ncbi:hypothetical protein ACFQ3Z_46245 [Streptomyces nogalater]
MNLTAALDHTALAAPFFTGLYIEASHGTGRVTIPSLSVLATERQVADAGRHAGVPAVGEHVPFTATQVREQPRVQGRPASPRPSTTGPRACPPRRTRTRAGRRSRRPPSTTPRAVSPSSTCPAPAVLTPAPA